MAVPRPFNGCLNERVPNQKQIALGVLRKIGPSEVTFGGINAAVISEEKRVSVFPALPCD